MIVSTEQRWTPRGAVFVAPSGEWRPRAWEVAAIADDTTARAFVERLHYSHSYPAARRRFGLYHRADLVGVAVFSEPVLGPTSETPIATVIPDVSAPPNAVFGPTSPTPVEEPVEPAPEPEPTAAPEPSATDVTAQPAPITPTIPAIPEEQPMSKPTKTAKQPKTARPAPKRSKPRKQVPAVVSELRALTESLAAMFGGGR